MKSFLNSRGTAPFLATLALPTVALAHPADVLVFDCASGIAHPFHGLDHLLAMISVGVWAAQVGGSARWQLPAAFLAAMTAGAALGTSGISLPVIEPLIAASAIALGLMVATALRISQAGGVAAVAAFALIHGNAHGTEMLVGTDPAYYALGFLASTAALLVSGLGLGAFVIRFNQTHLRFFGAACALMGVELLVG